MPAGDPPPPPQTKLSPLVDSRLPVVCCQEIEAFPLAATSLSSYPPGNCDLDLSIRLTKEGQDTADCFPPSETPVFGLGQERHHSPVRTSVVVRTLCGLC